MKRRRLIPAEDQIQAAIVDLLKVKGHRDLLYFAVPNGIPCTPQTGARFVKLGLRAGVADLCFVLPTGLCAFLEIKTPAGKQSIEQKAFQLRCEAIGVPYEIARSVTEAERILSKWNALHKPEQLRRAA